MKTLGKIKTALLSIATVLILFSAVSCSKNDDNPKEDPVITWEDPEDIYVDTPLDDDQLNATSDVPGTFIYTPAAGTYLTSGAFQELKADFTPDDLESYNVVSKSVRINVFGRVTDFDGNVYKTIVIGSQTWLAENLRSIHYSDGTLIPDVVSYQNSEQNALKYGRLYTWDATMKGETSEGSQGISPTGWHIPSDNEWTQLDNFLGGPTIAGGKMKLTTGWDSPNTGATNESGFSALPGGEYDSHDINNFQLIKEYAVFWTSTNISTVIARERYLSYNNSSSSTYDWYKEMKYSVRCIKD